MYFRHTEHKDNSQITISTSTNTRFRELVPRIARDNGYNLVASAQYTTDSSDPTHISVASVHGLEQGDLLDERHTTVYTAEIVERSELTPDEKNAASEAYYTNPESIDTIYEITLPAFDSLVEMLHNNSDEVTAPLSDETSRCEVTQRIQEEIINSQIISWQYAKGDLFTNPETEEHEYDDLYPNLRQHNNNWADSALHHQSVAEDQAEGMAVEATDMWSKFFDIPYLFYSKQLLKSYYDSKYRFDDMFWQQTELYSDVPELTQCRDCSRIRLESNLTEDGSCDDRNCSPTTMV